MRRLKELRRAEKILWGLTHVEKGRCPGDNSELHDAAHAVFRTVLSVEHPGWEMSVPKEETP